MKTNKRFLFLASLGILETTNENGEYDIQRIDNPKELKENLNLDFLPPILNTDNEAKRLFLKIDEDFLAEKTTN